MFRLLPLLALLATSSVAAQDPILTVADELNLSDAQVEIVRATYRPDTPGMAWTLTAELAPTLTNAQRMQLLATPGSERRTGLGPDAAQGRDELSRSETAAAKAARDAALGLDARQSAELDRALLDGRDDRGDRALTPGVARLLNDRQEDLVRMQRGIVRLLFRAELSGPREDATRDSTTREGAREAARRRAESAREGARDAARTRNETTREGAREAARTRNETTTRDGARDAARARREAATRDGAREAARGREAAKREAAQEAARARREAAAREAARRRANTDRDGTTRDGSDRDGLRG